MTFTFRPAKRESMPLLIGLAGATGSGKTYSALRVATGLAGGKTFAVIDTENGRALHYADDFEFEHGDLRAPFRPDAYADAIEAADQAGYPVIVVDSASHEHAGDGGLLDWQAEELERMGGQDSKKFTAWIKPKMSHKAFVSRLLQVRAHVILCFRAEAKIDIIRKPGGGIEVVPKASPVGSGGWIPVAEKNLPYEMTVSFLLEAERPGVPVPIKLQAQHREFVRLDGPLDEDAGRLLGEWAAGSSTGTDEVVELRSRLIQLGDHIGKHDEISKALAQPRDAAWLRRAIAKAEKSLEEAGSDAHPPSGEASPASSSDSEPGEQSQFEAMVPSSARQEDRG